MKNKILFFILLAFIFLVPSFHLFAQTEDEDFDDEDDIENLEPEQKMFFFPGDLNVHPFASNFLEPRLGFQFQTGKNDIRLDIGNSKDIFHYFKNEITTISLGVDFFTYTRLKGESNFHFPVDAVDYLFGVNMGITRLTTKGEVGLRFRLSHISAHFADGHIDKSTATGWRDDRVPNTYSREFVELTPYFQANGFRGYLGLTYLFHVNPETVGKGIYQAGFEHYFKYLSFRKVNPFVAYDFKLSSPVTLAASNTVTFGIKAGEPYGEGFSLLFTYFNGFNVHGEYFNLKEEYFSIGFNVDL